MKIRIWLALIAVYIFWGTTYLAIRFAIESIPPFLMASARFLAAGAILYVWRRAVGDRAPTRLNWRSAAIIGFLMLTAANGGVGWAEQRVASGITALLIGTVPLFMVILDFIRPGGKLPNWQAALGVLIGFAGVAYLIAPIIVGAGVLEMDLTGSMVILLASLLWALGSLYSRKAPLPESPLLGTGMEMLVGGVGLVVLGTITGEWGRLDLAEVSQVSLFGLVYLIIFGSLVAFAAYTWLLRVAPTPLVSTYAYVNPLVAISLGALLAGETITPRLIVSALIILGAVALINTASSVSPVKSEGSPGDKSPV